MQVDARRDRYAVARANALQLRLFDNTMWLEGYYADAEIDSALLQIQEQTGPEPPTTTADNVSLVAPSFSPQLDSSLLPLSSSAFSNVVLLQSDDVLARKLDDERVARYKENEESRLIDDRVARDRAASIALLQRSPSPLLPALFANPNDPRPYPDYPPVGPVPLRPPTRPDLADACHALALSSSGQIDITDDLPIRPAAEHRSSLGDSAILPSTVPASPTSRGRPSVHVRTRGSFTHARTTSSLISSPLSTSGFASVDDGDVEMEDVSAPGLSDTQPNLRRSIRNTTARSLTPAELGSDSSGTSKRTRVDVPEHGQFVSYAVHSLYTYFDCPF